MKNYRCRMCKNSNLELLLDLGFHPPSDAFLTEEELNQQETYYPLKVIICKECGLWQLDYVVNRKVLYQKNYPYESSVTQTGRQHFNQMAEDICKEFKIQKGSLIIDIGSNVGVLLNSFKSQDMKVLGIDPAINMASLAVLNGTETIADFFNYELAKKIKKIRGYATVITATNVFAHIDNLEDLIRGINYLLDPRGIFVIEVPYLVNLIENLEYDTIYHEHLSYISIKPLYKFFKKFDLELFDAKNQQIHGGTIRCFIGKNGVYKVKPIIKKLISQEEKAQIYSPKNIRETFVKKIVQQRQTLINILRDLKNKNKKIVGVSAPVKGNTLLNFCHITNEFIDYITEKASIKVGLYTPGTHIKIEPDSKLLKDKPDYALILAWNFANEIMENLIQYKKIGGKFIIPIPKPKII